MEITGTLINYYFHCKRQCWLSGNRINMEYESEDVQIGKALHQERLDKKKGTELKIDNIVVDQLTDKYLVEIKRSDADMEAAKWQIYFYLKVLREKGMERIGRLEVLEKHSDTKRITDYTLTPEIVTELEVLTAEIEQLIASDEPPKTELANKCKRCAYGAYCGL